MGNWKIARQEYELKQGCTAPCFTFQLQSDNGEALTVVVSKTELAVLGVCLDGIVSGKHAGASAFFNEAE